MKQRERDAHLLGSMMVMRDYAGNLLNSKEHLSAQEMIEGVRLPHEDFIRLVDLACAAVRTTDAAGSK